jgi:uncharacterized membrane protein
MPFPRSGRAVQNLSAAALSTLLLASAMKHFRDPGFFRQVVPDYLCREDAPSGSMAAGLAAAAGTSDGGTSRGTASARPLALLSREEWIALSGLVELAAAVGILIPATRRATATGTAIMFTVFLAGHLDALRQAYGPQGSRARQKVHTLRLPLQAPLIAWAWSLRRETGRARP